MTRSFNGQRRFGRRFVWTALAVALSLLVAACGGSSADDSAGGSATSEPPAEGDFDRDAEATIITYAAFSELDPHKERAAGDRPFWTPVYDTLLYDYDGSPEPGIATDWTRSDDGLTWTFTLREDAQFHDGTPVDAAAVAASLDRARTLPESTVAPDMTAIASVEATGDFEVTITMDSYDPKLLAVLSGPGGAILNPAGIESGHDFSAEPDGSGAYVVTNVVPAESATYERAETQYWDPEGGRLAGFSISSVNDFDTALSGLQSGQYDAAWIIGSGDKIESAVASGNSLVDEVLSPTTVLSLYLSNAREPFDDPRVRQALSYAIDRQGLTDALFNGGADCMPVSYNFPYEGDPLHIEGFDPYPYDLAKAEDLLAEAGVESASMVYSDIGSSNDRLLAEALQPMFEEIGFDVEVRRGTTAAIDDYRADAIDGIIVTNARQVYPTAALSRYWLEGGSYNSAGGEDDELKRLIAQLEDPQLSEDERDATFEAITEETARLMTIIPVCLITNHIVHGSNLTGFAESATPATPLNMRYVGVLADS